MDNGDINWSDVIEENSILYFPDKEIFLKQNNIIKYINRREKFMKQNIYDIKTFSEAYDKMRYENRGKNANDLIEIPNFRKLIPDFK